MSTLLHFLQDYFLILIGALWITWVWFSAVMRWRELHDQGKLDSKHLVVRWAIYINLAIGLVFDAFCNFWASGILLELPRYDLRIGDGTKWYNREILLTLAGIMSAAQLGIIKYYYDGSKSADKVQSANIARSMKSEAVVQDIAKAAAPTVPVSPPPATDPPAAQPGATP